MELSVAFELEDCAHGCGVTWRGRQLGYHGKLAAYSTQSDKVINSGEGGFVTTDDDAIAAQLIYNSIHRNGCMESSIAPGGQLIGGDGVVVEDSRHAGTGAHSGSHDL